MGLSIIVYPSIQDIKVVENPTDEEIDQLDDNGYIKLYLNRHFPNHSEDIKPDTFVKETEESFSFSAGSYMGFGHFREMIATIANYPEINDNSMDKKFYRRCYYVWEVADSGPFYEFINFSDCEGTIGPKTCAKLAKDFSQYKEKAMEYFDKLEINPHISQRYKEIYNNFLKAFTVTSNSGAISFC